MFRNGISGSMAEEAADIQQNTDILGMDGKALEDYLGALGEPRFRAKQIFGWLHEKLAADYDEMTNLPKALRKKLAKELPIRLPKIEVVQESRLDGTRKYLFSLRDGHRIESVLMRYEYGNSVCISSQVGCAMGCAFCASTVGGQIRNLTAGEMLGQVYGIRRELAEERVSHIVVMGTGEPLLNLDNLIAFIRMISDEGGQHLSRRNLTVSTCGIVPGIERLADEGLPITLALSLHAPTQEQREQIMPVARRYDLSEVLAACRHYFEKTGRRVTFEYAMIRDVNDRDEDARALTELLAGMQAHVNLIPLNEVAEYGVAASARERIRHFAKLLEVAGVNVTVRRSLGADIDGACGQLRNRYVTGKA